MSTPLTAARLNALVKWTFEMPRDGTRRGLWDRVPELQPRKDYRVNDADTRPDRMYPLVYVDNGMGKDGGGEFCWEGDGHGWEDAQNAAALIRVEIEDWLLRISTEYELEDGQECIFKAVLSAPTFFEGLVVAAHAVADAIGVPH